MQSMRKPFDGTPPRDGGATSSSCARSRAAFEQKMRKRETDKRAQRAHRERAKNRIAYLEELVRELKQSRGLETETESWNNTTENPAHKTEILGSPTECIHSVPRKSRGTLESPSHASAGINIHLTEKRSSQQLSTRNQSRQAGRDLVSNIQAIDGELSVNDLRCSGGKIRIRRPSGNGFSPAAPATVMDTPPTNNMRQSSRSSHDMLNPTSFNSSANTSCVREETNLISLPPEPLHPIICAHHISESGNTGARSSPIFNPSPDPLYDLLNFDPAEVFWNNYQYQDPKPFLQQPCELSDREKWHSTDNMYKCALTSYNNLRKHGGADLSYPPFAALINGWDTLDEKERTHPIWASLYWISESVYGSSQPNAQRIAMMFLKYLVMQYLSMPTKSNLERIPLFMRPRPSQEVIEHPLLIDFLIWPGLRDRLVFHHQIYSTGAFSRAYARCLRFNWPFSDADILEHNSVSQNWGLSALFMRYACNVVNWTMTDDFFSEMVELKLDIR